MSDLVGNPEDWFSRVAAHFILLVEHLGQTQIKFLSTKLKDNYIRFVEYG